LTRQTIQTRIFLFGGNRSGFLKLAVVPLGKFDTINYTGLFSRCMHLVRKSRTCTRRVIILSGGQMSRWAVSMRES